MDINFFWREKYLKSKHQERFNLLLLEPGEIYFEDFSVYYYSSEHKENEAIKRRQKGRLKICSKSLVFEPADTNYPIIKFLYKNVININLWNGSLLSRLETKGDVIFLETNACTHLKEGNVIAPYKHIKKKSSYYFSLNFVPSSSVLPQIDQLLRAHTLNPHTADEMIKTIIAARQAMTKFDCSWVEDLYETIVLETAAWKISPLVCNPGTLLLTSKQLYFQPFNNVEPEPVLKVRLNTIRSVLKRRYLLRHVGLEIMGNQDKHDVYFIFTNSQERDLAHAKLIEQKEVKIEQDQQDNMTLKWQNGVVSNFEYLLYLNSLADRSFNDLTQYPVFPWVISDYTSSTLDLNCPQTFRDLSKPIGALNQQRLKQLKERCNCMPEPKFLYGSHYSSPGFVLFYLVRVAPEYMLCLQNGKFDHADRLFSSILPTWKNCCSGHSDFKEVIPEFYNSDGSFLLNSKKLDLGIKQDGSKIGDVQLPTWASDAEDFVKKCREALECDYVSNEIHNWIDLIFGYKQTGQEAWKADNVFYYLTYEGAIDLDSIDSAREKHCLEAQIMEFGQTPKQLFFKPHPRRKPLQIPLEIGNIVLQVNTENPNDEKNDTENKEEITISVSNKVKDEKSDKSIESINSLHWISHLKKITSIKLHKCAVLCMDISRDGNTIYSVSQDSQLKIYSVKEGKQIRSISLSSMALSQCKLLEEENKMIVTSWDSQMYVYSLDYGRVIEQHHVHDDAVSGLCLPSSDRVVTSSWDSTVKLWKRERNKKQLNLIHEMEHDTEVLCCDCFLDNIVAGTKDGFLSLWYEDSMTSQINLHCDALTKVLFNEAGDRVLACSLDGNVKVIDVISNVEVFLKSLQNVQITDASWDGELVVMATDKGDVVLLDLNKNEPVQAAHVQTGGLKSLAVSRDQRILVTGGNKGYLTVFTADETNNS